MLNKSKVHGSMFCRDCWYLYTLNPLDRYLTGKVDMEPDQTIEILMTDLDPEIMKIFTKQEASDGREATKVLLNINLVF